MVGHNAVLFCWLLMKTTHGGMSCTLNSTVLGYEIETSFVNISKKVDNSSFLCVGESSIGCKPFFFLFGNRLFYFQTNPINTKH